MMSATMTMMRASPEQRKRTKAEEGLRLDAYKDTVGIWTVGYGHAATNPRPIRGLRIVYQKDADGSELRDPITHKLIPVMDENGRPVLEFYQGKVCEGVQITPSEADRLFDDDMEETEAGINALLTQKLEQHQFDALVDFVHQYGIHKLATSTLLLKINFNPFAPAVLHQLMRWTMAGGEHQEYVWRRSARRAIQYNGSAVPQLLWTKCGPKGLPFAVKKNDQGDDCIDYSITPTIEKLIDLGKKKAEPYVFDPSKIYPAPASDSQEPAGKLGDVGGAPTAQNHDPASAATAGPLEGVGAQVDPSPPVAPIAVEQPPQPDKVPASVESSRVPAGEEGAPSRPPNFGPALPPKAPAPPATVEAKNPMRSTTIWGGMITALAPQLDQIGNILIAKSAVFGPPFLVLGVAMIILGRIGAIQPLSNAAPIRSQR
jgi:lysozyme